MSEFLRHWLAFGQMTLAVAPASARIVCGAVHPDAYRQAVCDLDHGHDNYHATKDRLTEWQTADVGKTGGISCVTIDRAAGHQHLTYGGPLKPGDATSRRRYPPTPLATAADGGPNRKARRAAKRGRQ